jgi:hypothetical protein
VPASNGTRQALEVRKNRPTLTINRIPQFIRQVTGDMRQMRPSIKTVPVDSRGDKDTAETIAGMIRYIENRSDAAGDLHDRGRKPGDMRHRSLDGGQGIRGRHDVQSGASHYVGIDDQVAVACDPDAKLPMKEDAKWWLIPVDISREAFKEEYPDASVEDFRHARPRLGGWLVRSGFHPRRGLLGQEAGQARAGVNAGWRRVRPDRQGRSRAT